MTVERSPLVDRFECESGAIEIQNENSMNSLSTKTVGFIVSITVLSLAFIAGRQSGMSSMQIPVVGYPQSMDKIKASHMSELASYTAQPGAADLAVKMNLLRGTKTLRFYISSILSNGGVANPLMTAASNRNALFGALATPSIANFVAPTALGSSPSTASAITDAFTKAGLSPPSSYKEYNYYGEYCTTHLFVIMKNGPSTTSNPGYGIQNDIISSTWTDVAISIGQTSSDMSAAGTNGLGNARFTIIFSTSFNWSPASKKPTKAPVTRKPTKNPATGTRF